MIDLNKYKLQDVSKYKLPQTPPTDTGDVRTQLQQHNQTAPPPSKGFFSNVGSFGANLVRGVVKPVVETVAAPFQAAKAAYAFSQGNLNEPNTPGGPQLDFTLPFLGKIEAPKDVQTQVGRSIQTVATGLGPVAGGAAFGGGAAIEEHKSPLAIAGYTVGGALLGKLADLGFKAVGGALKGTGKFMQTMGGGEGALASSAAKDVESILAPTTKANKILTQKIAPRLAQEIEPTISRASLLSKAEEKVGTLGEQIGKYWDNLPNKDKTNIKPMIQRITDEQNNLVVKGTSTVPESSLKLHEQLGALKGELLQVAQEGNYSSKSLRSLQQLWDGAINKKTGVFGLTGSESDVLAAQKTAANILRDEFAQQHPDIAAINKDFTFWKRVTDVLSSTIERKTGQAKTGLGAKVLTGGALAAGAGSHGILGGLESAIVMRNLAKLMESTAWNSVSANIKTRLAEALANSDATAIGSIMNPIARKAGVVLEKAGNIIGGAGTAATELPKKNIPGTPQINLMDRLNEFLKNPKIGLQIEDVSAKASELENSFNALKAKRASLLDQGVKETSSAIKNIDKASKLISDKLAEIAPVPRTGSIEQLGETAGGWKPGMKAQFDMAMLHGDAATVKKLLPDVPPAYQKAFKTNIDKILKGEAGATTAKPAPVFTGFKDLTTKVLNKLTGRSSVSKQFISDLTNSGDLKQAERDVIRGVLKDMPNNVPVKDFANKVKTELLPLKRTGALQQYENITLPDELRGNVANYGEHIYQSPIKTSAGDVHFSYGSAKDAVPNYFAHTRVEDLAGFKKGRSSAGSYLEPDKSIVGDTRRVIELQSDLFQKGRLSAESQQAFKDASNAGKLKYEGKPFEMTAFDTQEGKVYGRVKGGREMPIPMDKFMQENSSFVKDTAKLDPYRNTWHERIIREEVKQAAKDGKTKLQFPTGETAMKIEGLGDGGHHWELIDPKNPASNLRKLESSDLETGLEINDGEDTWVVTQITGDGKFKATPKSSIDNSEEELRALGFDSPDDVVAEISNSSNGLEGTSLSGSSLQDYEESFDISGKTDKNNPIYKFYEKEVGRYLANKYGAKRITDPQGVSWYEVPIKKSMAKIPIEAFGIAPVSAALSKMTGPAKSSSQSKE